MKITVDDVWASPSTLHLRVTVHDDHGRWRHRFYPAVPTEQIPEEAIQALWKSLEPESDSRFEDLTLFD